MKRISRLVVLGLLTGCTHLGLGASAAEQRVESWNAAQQALAVEDFDRAAALFGRLAEESPGTREGRESLFFLGAMRLDPRNRAWNPEPAEQFLRRYLAADSAEDVRLYRRIEALTFVELARQLNMPAEQRVPGLQPETRVVRERVVVPAQQQRALAAEVERLRAQLAEREEELRKQKEELERIRKTLTRKRL